MSKIIKAVFTGRFCTCRRVFQYDTDDKLQLVNLDLPQNYTVDFANSLTGTSVSVLATSDTVQIPPDMIVPGSEIYAWVWISDTNGGHTKCQATIPIDPRAQRSGTSPAPAQASAWDQAVQTLNDAAADYETAASHAPIVQNGYWYIWDSTVGEYVTTNVKAAGIDGTDGNNAWTVDAENTRISDNYVQIPVAYMVGPSGASAKAGDIVFISDGRMTQITRIVGVSADTTLIGDLHGDPGEDGSGVWYTTERISGVENPYVRRRDLVGREGATVQVHDLLFAPDIGDEGAPTTLYEITSVGVACTLKRLCKMQGANGTDGASAYEIAVAHGYEGTEEEWLESLKGADAVVDPTLSNPGEAADAAETGKVKHTADYALKFAETLNNGAGIPLDAEWLSGDIGGSRPYRAHSKRAVNTEQKVLQAAAGYRFYLRIYDNGSYSDSSWYGPAYASRLTYTLPEGADYILVVSTSPEDQSVTADPEAYGAQVTIRNNIGSGGGAVSSVNGQTGAVTLSIPTKTSDLSNDSGFLTQHQDISGKLDVAQGSGNAGKFLVVGSDGNVTAVTMSAWQGGSY